ncbi:MAG TPA: hypothetical protein VGO93_20920 [Candidatus Xenobia bacterium]
MVIANTGAASTTAAVLNTGTGQGQADTPTLAPADAVSAGRYQDAQLMTSAQARGLVSHHAPVHHKKHHVVKQTTVPGGPKVQAMVTEANHLVGRPYEVGGGHGGWGPSSGYDCSGFVSAVLHAGGYLSEPQTTVTLPGQRGIDNGPGKHVTIYDRSLPGQEGHVIIDINGQFYESGGGHYSWGGGGGVEKIGHPDQGYLSTFDRVLHPAGL